MLFPAVRHEVSFWHGNDRLVGDLVLPAEPGPHPVAVVIGDPAEGGREHGEWLDALALAGHATFTWDRVDGAGSESDPVRRSAHLAREALAACARVRTLPHVDEDAVALFGWGEGGWAAAQAATFSSDVSALVLACTPTTSPDRLLEHRVLSRLRAAGFAGGDVDAARDLFGARVADVVHGWAARPGDPGADRGAASAEPGPGAGWWQQLAGMPEYRCPDPRVLAADPLPTLSAVTVPVLALFGEQDPLVPLADSVRGLRTTLRSAGHTDHEIAVVRGADHGLRVRPGHGLGRIIDGRHQFGEWPPGLTRLLADWLDARLRPLCDVPAYPPPAAPEAADGPASPWCPGRETSWSMIVSGPPPGAGRAAFATPPAPVRQVRRRVSR